ncbi:MAG: hypothetical protein EBS08_02545, partial [Cytophagia bacterium]|nr:hypothetical protein [Cytophagia bacterium]
MKFLLYLETQLLRNLQREDPRAHSIKGKRAGTPPNKARRELPAWLVWIWEHKDGQPHSLTRLQSPGSQAKGFPDSSISSNNAIPQVFLLERATDTD